MPRFEPVRSFLKEQATLPHWQGPGHTYFVRYSLSDARIVDLTDPRIAPLTISSLRHFDGSKLLLFDYTVMPDHVHCIIKPLADPRGTHNLRGLMRSVKHFSARGINLLLHREGRLWQEEHYDHVLRNEQDYREKAQYIYMNPVQAGLIDDPARWPWWGVGSEPR